MKYWLQLLALALLPALSSAQGEVRYGPEKVAASIGEEIVWVLSARHPEGRAPQLANSSLDLDPSWVVLGDVVRASELGAGEVTTHWKWTVLSLTSGERRLPSMTLKSSDGESFEVVSEAVNVSAELLPDEDAPRALAGFQRVTEDRQWLTGARLVLINVAMLLAVTTFAYVRRRRTPKPIPVLDPRQRIVQLRQNGLSGPDETRAMHFELSSLVRFAVEEQLTELPEGLAGLTDEEWLEFVRSSGQVEDALVSQLGLFFSSCGRVKYGLQIPTKFLADETLARAEDIVTKIRPHEVSG